MKKSVLILILIILSACSSTESEPNYVYTTTTFTGSIAAAPSSGGSSASYSGNANDYMIVVQNQVSRRIYISQIHDDGSFKFNEDGSDNKYIESVDDTNGLGNHFMMMLLRKSPLEIVATTYVENTTDEGISGLTFDGNINNTIYFDVDEANDRMTISKSEVNAIDGVGYDENFKVRLSSNKPVGSDDFGKSSESQTSTTNEMNYLDPDEDGQPNIFDGMNNGQDLDNLNEENKAEGSTISDSLESSIMFMNLKIDYESSANYTVTDNAIIVLEVVPRSSASISSIRVAELISTSGSNIRLIHPNYENALIEKFPNGFTQIDTYPAENSLWSDSDYKLFKAQNSSGTTIYTTLIKPKNNDFEPGDLVLLEVNLTDGSKEYYFNSINFKFETLPIDTTSWTHGGAGSTSSPFIILDTGGRVFSWNDPIDETGTTLSGLDYRFEVFYYTDNSGQCDPNVTYQIGEMVVIEDRESGVTDKNDISQAEIDNAGATTQCVQLDIAGSYPFGDNTALKYYFKRSSW